MKKNEGAQLYEFYAKAMESHNVGVEEWEDLDETDQMAWEQAAADFRRSLGL